MAYIRLSDIEFIKEAIKWRDESRSKGKPASTYRNEEKTHIALFMDGTDDILVYELGPEVAYFEGLQQKHLSEVE